MTESLFDFVSYEMIDDATKKVFQSAAGRPLSGLTRDQYLFDGIPAEVDSSSLELQFESLLIKLYLGSDGESVLANEQPIDLTPAFSIDENSHCEWRLINLLDIKPWSRLREQRLKAIDAITDRWEASDSIIVSAWIVKFDSNYLCYLNNGDDSKLLFDALPPDHPDKKYSTSYLPILG